MKIALVILHADSARGGAERYTLDLAEALTARGHDVSILATSFQETIAAGRRVQLSASGATRTRRYLAFLDSVDRELQRVKFDIVHAMLPVRSCDLYHPHAGIAAEAISAAHLNKPGVLGRGLAWLGNRFNTRRRRFAAVERSLLGLDHPPVVLCLSRLIQAVVSRHYPQLPTDRLVPIFNGVDLTRFDPTVNRHARQKLRKTFKIPESAIVGLLLAQDFERKGLGQAVAALAKIDDPNFLLLVGGKPDPAKYQQQAVALDVARRVLFAGPVEYPADFYQAADFFVLPTRFDPCSLVVLEALAMGLPAISTVRNGACEIMQDNVHGRVLTDPEDVRALSAAMCEMTDRNRRLAMSTACLNLRPRLSQDWHVTQLEAAYLALISARVQNRGDLVRQ